MPELLQVDQITTGTHPDLHPGRPRFTEGSDVQPDARAAGEVPVQSPQ